MGFDAAGGGWRGEGCWRYGSFASANDGHLSDDRAEGRRGRGDGKGKGKGKGEMRGSFAALRMTRGWGCTRVVVVRNNYGDSGRRPE